MEKFGPAEEARTNHAHVSIWRVLDVAASKIPIEAIYFQEPPDQFFAPKIL